MKRVGNLYQQIADFENLRLAFVKAARGKQHRPDVIAFNADFNHHIETLRNQIQTQNFDIGNYRFFLVYDPKKRLICAASFPERVLHHAVMNVCEPILDRYAIFDSYACRKGKGAHRAVMRAQTFCSRFDWYLKLDIRKYFDSIDHDILMGLLARRFKDTDLLSFFKKVCATYHTRPNKGMPIGNLISQHLANFYLGPLDRFVKEALKIKGYLRYMDDFILFGFQKQQLAGELRQVEQFLAQQLELKLKEPHQLNRCRVGVPFLGYRVFGDRISLSAQSKARFIKKFRCYESNWLKGRWTCRELTRHLEPLFEFTRLAQATQFRRNTIKRFGVSS